MNQQARSVKYTEGSCSNLSVCPTCKGTGFKVFEEPHPEVYGNDVLLCMAQLCPDCRGVTSSRTEMFKKSSNIPLTYYNSKYSDFNWGIYQDSSGKAVNLESQKKAVDDFINAYREWKKEGLGFYIYSKTKGSGKSFLASCICNELMQRYNIKTYFVNTSKLLDIAQSGDKDSPDKYKREPLELLSNCELLVLDDIGQKRTGGEWLSEILFKIVDDRMNQRLVTIFTSNVELDSLNIDERIIERINKIAFTLGLPEYNVRSRDSIQGKLDFIKRRSLR